MSSKIQVKTPIIEIDGDEMTKVMWHWTKTGLILPFVCVPTIYFDAGLENRKATKDKVTKDAAQAFLRQYKEMGSAVSVKCATITPDVARMEEYDLEEQYKSPNGQFRNAVGDGTIFRVPIVVGVIPQAIQGWEYPLHVARHGHGDIYKNKEIKMNEPGKVELTFTPHSGGTPIRQVICELDEPGIAQGVFNTDASIRSFAQMCFLYAFTRGLNVVFHAKHTISKTYDANFKAIFQEEFDHNWKKKFEAKGLFYFYTLVDDAIARLVGEYSKPEEAKLLKKGILLACKNYDGDVFSDMVAAAYGSLAMMTSVLISPRGMWAFEAAHGTVQKHFYRYQKGEKTSTNPTAIIFCWAGGLRKRGELDETPEVIAFADKLEQATIETIEAGIMTGDLIRVTSLANPRQVNTEEFIFEVGKRLELKLK